MWIILYSIGPLLVHPNLWWYIKDGSMSTVAVYWNTTQQGISVYSLPWVLSKVGAVSGFDCILLWICSGKLYVYKSVFYLLPVQEEIIGDLQCGFQWNGSITDHIFWICQNTWEIKWNTMRQCTEVKEAYGSVKWEVGYNTHWVWYPHEIVKLIKVSIWNLQQGLGRQIRGLLEKYPTLFFYANTWWIII